MISLELLSPARNADVAMQAILHGADAVYIGGPSHGARAAASNAIDDIARAVDFAHCYGARVYVTLNTLIYESELAAVERDIHALYRIGVDALIVQDMGILRMDLPPIALHASTQCDIRSVEKAQFLAKCGFSQLVLPRELSLEEISAIRESVDRTVALEAFVHGALCVSYSGDCQASYVANGRSANRGECAQMCRMSYDLVDAQGRKLIEDKHLLSLRDLNRLPDLGAMAAAGISSFKIEGRLKDANYVKVVVSAYRRALDRLISSNPELYGRESYGNVSSAIDADVNKAFNRGFTPYFLNGGVGSKAGASMANFDTPKWVGERVGEVLKVKGNCIEAKLSATLANGDGLGFFDKQGRLNGFRLNRIDGNRLYPASPTTISVGAELYRNNDVQHDAALARETAVRHIPVKMALRQVGNKPRVALSVEAFASNDANAPRIAYVETAIDCGIDIAKNPQRAVRMRILDKLGDTRFKLIALDDSIPEFDFIPASSLARLRRDAIAIVDKALKATYRYDYRRREDCDAQYPQSALTYHDNVANSKAEAFYVSHGVGAIEPALEAMPKEKMPKDNLTVMTTRYCLRRELGACIRDGKGGALPDELYIQNKAARFRLQFDCKNCRMHLKACK